METQKFLVDSRGHCFLCLARVTSNEKCLSTGDKAPDDGREGQGLSTAGAGPVPVPPKIFSFHHLTKYLKLKWKTALRETLAMFTESSSLPMPLLKGSELSGTLCDQCAQLSQDFSGHWRELEEVEGRLDNCLKLIHGRMDAVERNVGGGLVLEEFRREMLGRPETIIPYRIVEGLRKVTLERCSRKLNIFPPPPPPVYNLQNKAPNPKVISGPGDDDDDDIQVVESPVPRKTPPDCVDLTWEDEEGDDDDVDLLKEPIQVQSDPPRVTAPYVEGQSGSCEPMEVDEVFPHPGTKGEVVLPHGDSDEEHELRLNRRRKQVLPSTSAFVDELVNISGLDQANKQVYTSSANIPPPRPVTNLSGLTKLQKIKPKPTPASKKTSCFDPPQPLPLSAPTPVATARPRKCSLCSLIFYNEPNFRRHLSVLHQIEIFDCTPCRMEFMGRDAYDRHLKKWHPTPLPRFSCQRCGKRFETLTAKRAHHKGCKDPATQRKPTIIRCTACGKEYSDADELRRHYKTLHLSITHDQHLCPGSGDLGRGIGTGAAAKQPDPASFGATRDTIRVGGADIVKSEVDEPVFILP